MSHQSAQTAPPSDLDATVDGLLAAPDASASAAPAIAPASSPATQPPTAGLATLDAALSEGDMLSDIAGEIDRAAPAAVSTASAHATDFAAPEDLAAPARSPAPAKRASAHQIERLDEAIASDADRLLAEAQADLPPEPAPRSAPIATGPFGDKPFPAPSPAPAAAAPAAAPKPAPAAPTPPVAHPSPIAPAPAPRAVEVVVVERPIQAEPKPAGPSVAMLIAAKLAAPLRPLADFHERLGESARQTIAYCSILTMFCAACAWGMPRFMRAKDLQPITQGQTLYDDTTPAHNIKAPARHDAAHAASSDHGSDHGDAKKPSKAKEKKADDKKAKKPAKAAAPAAH